MPDQNNNTTSKPPVKTIDPVVKSDIKPVSPPITVEETLTPDPKASVNAPTQAPPPMFTPTAVNSPPPPPSGGPVGGGKQIGDQTTKIKPSPQASGNDIDLPPVIATTGKSKTGGGTGNKKRIIATILGLLFLVGSVAAGTILVQRNQDIGEKAAKREMCDESSTTAYKCRGQPVGKLVEKCWKNGNTGTGTDDIALRCERTTGTFCGAVERQINYVCEAKPDGGGNGGGGGDTEDLGSDCIFSPWGTCSDECKTAGILERKGDCKRGYENWICQKQWEPDYDTPGGECEGADACPWKINEGEKCCPDKTDRCNPDKDKYICIPDPFVAECVKWGDGSCQGGGRWKAIVHCTFESGGLDNPLCKKYCDPPKPTNPPFDLTCNCTEVLAFGVDGVALTAEQLSALVEGDVVTFAVRGTASSGAITKARFTINGTLGAEITGKQDIGGVSYYATDYTIPAETTSFSVKAELYHPSVGWF